jgi:transaldolase
MGTDFLKDLKIKIFADGADFAEMCRLYADPRIQGLTTNPTLMRKAGIPDYEAFAREVLSVVKDKPISFEVFSDDFNEMNRQASKIAEWQDNVYVKIPVTNTHGESSAPLIRSLSRAGVKLNVTAILTTGQVQTVVNALEPHVPSVLSIFAGRIADTGIDPQPVVCQSLRIVRAQPKAEVLWASVREVLNIFHAEQCGCHIVTVPHDILAKADRMWGTALEELSRETVKMFAGDAIAAGFSL